MSIIKWEPFAHMDKFFDDDLFAMPLMPKFAGDGAIDLYEDGDNLVAEINLPGFDTKHIDVNIDEDILRVKGERSQESEKKEKNFFTKEIKRGSFERAMRLPHAVDAEKTKAEKKDGVLIVTMPKKNRETRGGTSIKIT